jgi:hypothetical protein
MAQKQANPVTLAADRARKSDCLAVGKPDYSDPLPQLQELRAHFLARRFAISPDLAMLLATLALGEVRA